MRKVANVINEQLNDEATNTLWYDNADGTIREQLEHCSANEKLSLDHEATPEDDFETDKDKIALTCKLDCTEGAYNSLRRNNKQAAEHNPD